MGLNLMLLILVGAVFGVYIFVFGFLKRFNELCCFVKLGNKVYRALPPGDMGWPLLGSTFSFYKAFSLGGHPESFINHLISRGRGGRIGMYRSHIYGRPSIIVTEAEICRRIFTDEDHFKTSYPQSMKKLGGEGSLMSASGPRHKFLHKLTAAPINGSEALSLYVHYIEQTVMHWLEECSSINHPIHLLNETKTLTFKIISRVFLGSASAPHMADLQRLYREYASGIMSIFPYDFPGFSLHRALKAKKVIGKILQSMIDEKRRALQNNEEIEEKCQMEALIKAADDENIGGKYDVKEDTIVDLLIGQLYAGYDTTAHAAMWALIHITDYPQIFQKAKEEQELIIKERPSTQKGLNFKEIKQMKYLAKVINEVLRKTTIAFTVFREAKTDVNINGYIIPKGWNVPIWIRAVHMDPQIYPNPQEFDPSRWDNYVPKPGTFIPFALGNRYCPGSELAKLEITILLHHFLLNYKLERVNSKCEVTHIPIPKPEDNCLSKIIKVDSTHSY